MSMESITQKTSFLFGLLGGNSAGGSAGAFGNEVEMDLQQTLKYTIVGGTPTTVCCTDENSCGFDKWISTVFDSPEVIKFEVAPIYGLVQDGKKKNNIIRAYKTYYNDYLTKLFWKNNLSWIIAVGVVSVVAVLIVTIVIIIIIIICIKKRKGKKRIPYKNVLRVSTMWDSKSSTDSLRVTIKKGKQKGNKTVTVPLGKKWKKKGYKEKVVKKLKRSTKKKPKKKKKKEKWTEIVGKKFKTLFGKKENEVVVEKFQVKGGALVIEDRKYKLDKINRLVELHTTRPNSNSLKITYGKKKKTVNIVTSKKLKLKGDLINALEKTKK